VVLLDGPGGKLPMLAVSDTFQPPSMPVGAPGVPSGVAGGVRSEAGSLSFGGGGGGGGGGDGGGGGGAVEGTMGGAGGDAGGKGGGTAQQLAPPRPAHHPQSIVMNVNGTMRRLQPVCAQALPWSTSFIGCPGIKSGEGLSDFTQLFKEDGSRDAGNRRTTPLEVENPKDIKTFHARSAACPWAKQNLQVTPTHP